jgi:hypothetical protein
VVPARRVVELSSRPSGALVLEDGEEKGTTPYRTDLEPARTRALVLRSPGFEEKTVRLSSSTPDRLEVSMKPLEKPAIPARAAPRPPKPPKTTPAKSPAGRPGTDLSVPD